MKLRKARSFLAPLFMVVASAAALLIAHFMYGLSGRQLSIVGAILAISTLIGNAETRTPAIVCAMFGILVHMVLVGILWCFDGTFWLGLEPGYVALSVVAAAWGNRIGDDIAYARFS